MKVALIHPLSKNQSFKVPPLGLAYITAVLKRNNIEAKVIDLNVEKISFYKYLINEKPEVIGVSSFVTNASQALEIIEQTKDIFPESFVVIGGPYPSMMGARLIAKHRKVDATVVGEGEFTFLELIKRLQTGKSLDSVKGLIFRKNNKIIINPLSKPISPVDQIPHPAREELKLNSYGENAGSIFTSRGCPQQCIFCSRPVFERKWRGHSPDYVLEEIELLINEYGVSTLSVLDDNFTVDLNRAEQILDGIIEKNWNLNIYFWNGMRADHITKTLVSKLKKAGCTTINFGVESVNSNVLSFIRKGLSLQQIEHAINLTRKSGIQTNIFLIIGNPGDNPQSVDKIIDFIEKMQVNGVHLSMATPILGTKFWDWVEKNGRWLDYDKEELLDWPVDDTDKAYTVFETPDFTAEERTEAYQKIRNLLRDRGLLI